MSSKIKDEKLQHDINREASKISVLSSGKIDEYEYLTGEEILPSDQSRVIEQAKFTYFPLRKAFQKQIKSIEEQREKQIKALEEHGKQPVKYNNEKGFLTHPKQKEIFEELANKRMEEKQESSKETDFNDLQYQYIWWNSKKFPHFKDLINFYREIKDGSTKLEEAQKNKKNLD